MILNKLPIGSPGKVFETLSNSAGMIKIMIK